VLSRAALWCSSIARGAWLLNDDQGGRCTSRLRMARLWVKFKSRSNGTWTRKKGFAEEQLGRLSGCIKAGLDEVKEVQEVIREYVEVIAEVARRWSPDEDISEREEKFEP